MGINLDLKFTEHFTYREMLHSDTADAQHITEQYEPSPAILTNLQRTANMLEQVRTIVSEHFGKDTPIGVTSAYRCERTNAAVGGVSNSQHLLGEAADIHVPGMTTEELYILLKGSRLVFDQLLQEFSSWVHVSIAQNNRGECWRYVKCKQPKRDN